MQRAVLGLRQDRGLCWASGRTEGCVGPQAGQRTVLGLRQDNPFA